MRWLLLVKDREVRIHVNSLSKQLTGNPTPLAQALYRHTGLVFSIFVVLVILVVVCLELQSF